MKTWKGYREESRISYGVESEGNTVSLDQLNCGSLMRIADALEKMAQPYADLVKRNARLEERDREASDCMHYWKLSNAALRGQITKLRKKIAGNGDNP